MQNRRMDVVSIDPIFDRLVTEFIGSTVLCSTLESAAGKYGDWFMLTPPLTISEEECNELARRLTATLIDCYEEYAAGAWQSG